ncbi:NADH ubiquinone oxidoreductase 20 kDa subunit, partial [mine drainage metagenome]
MDLAGIPARAVDHAGSPDSPPTEEELPPTSYRPVLAPLPPEAERRRAGLCPTDAIDGSQIDERRCLRCARCVPDGRSPDGGWDRLVPAPGEAGSPDAPAPLFSAPFLRSIHVFPIDVGSCQACNLEVLALANPYYDASRLGIFFTPSPRHADLLLVMGVPTAAMEAPFRRTLEAMP